jgi:hypothetical protein
MKRARFTLLGTLICISACTAQPESSPKPLTEKQSKLLDKSLAGKTPGKPVDCIQLDRSNDLVRVSDTILLYRQSSNLVYKNELNWSCHGLASQNDILVTETWGSNLCRGDIVRLVDPVSGLQGAACPLGDFIPYRKTPA